MILSYWRIELENARKKMIRSVPTCLNLDELKFITNIIKCHGTSSDFLSPNTRPSIDFSDVTRTTRL